MDFSTPKGAVQHTLEVSLRPHFLICLCLCKLNLSIVRVEAGVGGLDLTHAFGISGVVGSTRSLPLSPGSGTRHRPGGITYLRYVLVDIQPSFRWTHTLSVFWMLNLRLPCSVLAAPRRDIMD
jgi:hypothetical protein